MGILIKLINMNFFSNLKIINQNHQIFLIIVLKKNKLPNRLIGDILEL